MSETDEKKWPLAKYAIWENDIWVEMKIDSKNSYLIMSYTQLLIVSGEVALESLCLLAGIESIFANATIAIKVTDKLNRISKFRVCLAKGNNTGVKNCLEVMGEFQKFNISVNQWPLEANKKPQKLTEKTLPELAKILVRENRYSAVEQVMNERITTKSVRMFLLNPHSKDLVNKTLKSIFPKE